MTQQIGDEAFFTAFEEVVLSHSEESEEIDLIEEDSNIVFLGDGEGYDIEITFVLVESDFTFPKKRIDSIKKLSGKSVEINDFDYLSKKGRISISDVNIPDEGSKRTIRRGSISGIFMPWPKQYGDLDEPYSENYRDVYGSGGYGDDLYGKSVEETDYGYGNYGDGVYGE